MAHSPPNEACDFLIVGAGIAGAALAYELAPCGAVHLLEREEQPGYHSTGRSAALFTETYGNATMRALTRAGRGFYLQPPAGFAEHPILTPRGTLLVGTASQREALEQGLADCAALAPGLELWSGAQVRARVPVFNADQVDGAVWEPHAMDIDVHALHHGYLRGARARGATLHCNAGAENIEHRGGRWFVQTRQGGFSAPVLINAAGAWADEVARQAGVRCIGLQALRRTVITFDAPAGAALHDWPAVIDIDEQYYFKPEAGRLLGSLADETPSAPCDAQPDEYDVALLADRIGHATTLQIRRVHSKWAGLRSFVADRTMVAGYDAQAPGFFWLAAQGGYGIQTASAAARAAVALVLQRPLPSDLQDQGLAAGDLAPDRAALNGAVES